MGNCNNITYIYKLLILLIIFSVFIANCSGSSVLINTNQGTSSKNGIDINNSVILTDYLPQDPSTTQTVSEIPITTETPIIIEKNNAFQYIEENVTLQTNIPTEIELHGGIVVHDLISDKYIGVQVLNTITGDIKEINDFLYSASTISVAPDKNHILFESASSDSPRESFYIVQNTVTSEVIKFSKDIDSGWELIWSWINNEEILFTTDTYTQFPPGFIIYNPFTNEQRELPNDFPDFESMYPESSVSWPIFNRTQEFVLYPTNLIDGFDIVLYNVGAKEKINQYELGRLIDVRAPSWSNDGDKFVIVVYKIGFPINITLGNIDGGSEILIELTNEIPSASIDKKIWSPDDKYILLTIFDPDLQKYMIYIVDFEQRRFINTGIGFSQINKTFGDIYWSPNSKQIVFENSISDTENEVVIFDIPSMQAGKLMNNMNIYGWVSLKE